MVTHMRINICTCRHNVHTNTKPKTLLIFPIVSIFMKRDHTSWGLHKHTTSSTLSILTFFLALCPFATRTGHTILHSYSFLTQWPDHWKATRHQQKPPFLFNLYMSRISQCVIRKFRYVLISGQSFNDIPRLSKLKHNWYSYIIMNVDLTCCF